MKRLAQRLALVAVVAVTTGCASPDAYFIDRGRDAADIFTATIGAGFGAKARIGPLQSGLLCEIDLVGLRGGVFPSMQQHGNFCFPTPDLQGLVVGIEEFRPDCDGVFRRKSFCVQNTVPFWTVLGKYDDAWYYYTQIDVVVALLGSARAGFNPGELADFLLGWFGVDIYGDDLEAKVLRRQQGW